MGQRMFLQTIALDLLEFVKNSLMTLVRVFDSVPNICHSCVLI